MFEVCFTCGSHVSIMVSMKSLFLTKPKALYCLKAIRKSLRLDLDLCAWLSGLGNKLAPVFNSSRLLFQSKIS